MHEGALVEGVLAVVVEAAAGQPVRRVKLHAGSAQHLTPESLELYWRLLAEDTVAARSDVQLLEASAPDALLIEEIELENGHVLRNPQLVEVRDEH